jgi:hypothetical protein
MFVKLDKTAFMVNWEHGTGPTGQRFTKCFLHELVHKDEEPTRDNVSTLPSYEGMAVCSKKDQFSKNKGRKKSLSRAISNHLVFPLEARLKFWDAYFKMQGVCYDSKKLAKTLGFMVYEKIGP